GDGAYVALHRPPLLPLPRLDPPDPQLMNFHHVRAFCRIVAEGSFSRAADKLHITQPTISAQVQALEQHLGTRLFERSAKGIALTQAGRVFHGYAEQILEIAGRAEEAIEQLR